MPSDSATASVDVDAPPADVLSVLRDVERYPSWVKGFSRAEVLERDDAGRPSLVRFKLELGIGDDTFDAAITHADSSVSWSLVTPTSLQKAQHGSFDVASTAAGSTVTLRLDVEHSIRVPGFLRKKVFASFVQDAVNGLPAQV